MALAPKFAGQRFTPHSPVETLHTIELYLDYVCPYSAKMFKTIYDSIFPLVTERNYKVQFLFRHQVQPWHPSSTLVHEAGVAVNRLSPTHFWAFSSALFADQKAFYDVPVVNEPRNATYARLAKIGASVGVDESAMLKLLAIPDKPADDGSLNVGNGVTNDMKVLVKMARLVGVHVSPTVIVDGVVDNSISSGWSQEQWAEYLEKLSAS